MMPGSIRVAPILQRAVALHRAGQLAQAETLYRQVLAVDGEQADATHNLGAALAQHGRLSEALPYLMRALDLEPSRPKYWSVCIEALTASGKLAEAADVYRRLVALQPQLASAHHNLGLLLVRLGSHKEARSCFRNAVRLDPTLAAAHNNLGNLLKLEGRLEEAAASYRAAIAAAPQMAEAHGNLGVVLEQRGLLTEAESCFRKAIALSPDHPGIHRHLGAVLAEQGRTHEALEAFLRHARTVRAAAETEPQPHRIRHDQEQREYLGGAALDVLRLESGDRLPGSSVRPRSDAHAIAAQWQTGNPKLVVIDDLLTAEALEGLRRLCWGSTFWRSTFPNGYLGTLPEHGFAAPLLAQIGEDLRQAFPQIMGGHPLLQLWAFKYDSECAGTSPHADFAAVNVNFWITPDEANLDPQSGGLIVWDKAAPLDWDFARYNTDEAAIRAFLKQSDARAITIPYRANRAVIFDSDLFHETDRFRFRPGYTNRRINITYLYGWRAAGARG
jgi:tetratricopeptide (TPR) repeat protein